MIAVKQVDLNNVLLPPMLGPVINKILEDFYYPLSVPIMTSFGTNFLGADFIRMFPLAIYSCTQGCLTYLNSIYGSSPLSSIICGLAIGPLSVLALITAKAQRQSNSAVH